jgi:hypothetical protein
MVASRSSGSDRSRARRLAVPSGSTASALPVSARALASAVAVPSPPAETITSASTLLARLMRSAKGTESSASIVAWRPLAANEAASFSAVSPMASAAPDLGLSTMWYRRMAVESCGPCETTQMAALGSVDGDRNRTAGDGDAGGTVLAALQALVDFGALPGRLLSGRGLGA